MWLKVYKTFRGGRSKDDYVPLPENTEEDEYVDYARSWAENTSGGENYGWIVHWEPVEYPSIEWLKKELRYTISSVQRYIMVKNRKILRLLKEIECQKENK